ncbi:MAG: Wzz/FepE/Etk N-terminal domain-containing protein, partial [Gemmatimonadales bacterium]
MGLNHPPALREEAPPPSPDLRGWEGGDRAEATGLDWARVLSALRRFKWLAVIVTLLGTAAGVVATRVVRPVYVAQATIMVDAVEHASPERARGPIQAGELVTAQAWVDLLKSYLVLDQVARDLRLFAVPASPDAAGVLAEFAAGDAFRSGEYGLTVDLDGRGYVLVDGDGRELERGAVGDSVGRALGFAWAPERRLLTPGQTVRFTVSTPRDAARQLADALNIRMDLNANFLRLELQGASPQRVATTVNAVADRFVKVAAELKREKLSELTRSLGAQLEFAQSGLVAAEAALRQFRVRTITLPSEPLSGTAGAGASPAGQVDPAVTAFVGVQSELEEVRRDRAALERLLQNAGPDGMMLG